MRARRTVLAPLQMATKGHTAQKPPNLGSVLLPPPGLSSQACPPARLAHGAGVCPLCHHPQACVRPQSGAVLDQQLMPASHTHSDLTSICTHTGHPSVHSDTRAHTHTQTPVLPFTHTHTPPTHTHRTPILPFTHTHARMTPILPSVHKQQVSLHSHTPSRHNTLPGCTHTHSLPHTLTYCIHLCSQKRNTSPRVHSHIHTQNSLQVLRPPSTTPALCTHIHSAPPTAAAGRVFTGGRGLLVGTPGHPPLPAKARILGHTWPSRNRRGGGHCQGAGHSWNATAGIPHIPPCRGCPPGCGWQQVCSYNAGVWGEGGGVGARPMAPPGQEGGGGRGAGAETSGLWQPHPGPPKVGWCCQEGRAAQPPGRTGDPHALEALMPPLPSLAGMVCAQAWVLALCLLPPLQEPIVGSEPEGFQACSPDIPGQAPRTTSHTHTITKTYTGILTHRDADPPPLGSHVKQHNHAQTQDHREMLSCTPFWNNAHTAPQNPSQTFPEPLTECPHTPVTHKDPHRYIHPHKDSDIHWVERHTQTYPGTVMDSQNRTLSLVTEIHTRPHEVT